MNSRLAWTAALAGCLVSATAACTGGAPGPVLSAPALPACSTQVLAGWRTSGLAVLWVPAAGDSPTERVALPAAVAAVDAHSGAVRTYCPLPAPAPAVQAAYSLPMRQGGRGGTAYPDTAADPDLMLRTQWFSPDFRWFAAPGLPLVDVGAGRVVATPGLPGMIAGVGASRLLVRTGSGWCTAQLPPVGAACSALPRTAGAYVIGTGGAPVALPAAAVRVAFGPNPGYVLTDGQRVYRADTEPAATRRDPLTPVDIDPAGLGGFQTFIDAQPVHDEAGWFSVTPGSPPRVAYHKTTARHDLYTWMLGTGAQVSRALADGGRTAVTAAPALQGTTRITRFGALTDGSPRVVDLTVRCPVPDTYCRILAWPDNSLTPATQ